MKKSKFTETQIVFALKQAKAGTAVAEVCRLVREQTSLANRIQKLVESGNIKLGQVATDALGVSGLQMLRALAAGETNPEKMSSMARGPDEAEAGGVEASLERTVDRSPAMGIE